LFFISGCIGLQIQFDVDYPVDVFSQSMEKIQEIHKRDPYRKGEVEDVNFLVYDGKERKFISFSVPAKMAEDIFEETESVRNSRLQKYSLDFGDVNLDNLGDLKRIGPGLLVHIEDLKENTHVLVWLD
jgi:hypothetical protein